MSSSSQGAGPKVGLVEQAYETFASGLSRRGFWLPPVFTGTGATSAVGVPLQPEMDNDSVVLLVARSGRCSRLPSSVDSILLGAASTTAFGEVRPLPRFGRVTRERRVLTRTVHLQPVFYALLGGGQRALCTRPRGVPRLPGAWFASLVHPLGPRGLAATTSPVRHEIL
jgi:hypothetical protein